MDMRLRLVLAGVLFPAMALLFGGAPGGFRLALAGVGAICLLAGLTGYAVGERPTRK